mmetsp:Transcript_3272/g.5386  ORF Transcript_3272/g.5386 Transcript_3272/m.5386 type:complete len:252 (+) Transcript_3272:41-796(+)
MHSPNNAATSHPTMVNPRSSAFVVLPHTPGQRSAPITTKKFASFVEDVFFDVAASSAPVTQIQEFEPIVNVPALSSFLTISVMFGLLQLRINSVSQATKRRSAALESLRKVESLQLSTSDVDRPTEDDVARAKTAYENALTDELNLRTIIPGVRIVAPNDPKRDEEERAAAKRFLGWTDKDLGIDEYDKEQYDGAKSTDSQQKEGGGLSTSANFILALVGSTLIALLWTLSLDPMTANQALDAADQVLSSY